MVNKDRGGWENRETGGANPRGSEHGRRRGGGGLGRDGQATRSR